MKKSSKRQTDTSFSDTDRGHDRDREREEISRRAHSLWERSGRPEGRDEEFWFSAERELREQSSESETEENLSGGNIRQMEMSARPAGGPAIDDQNESRTADPASTRGSRAHR